MITFLQYVARDILAKHPEGLQDVAVVFPNKRASLFLNQALIDAAGQPLWSPAYITISDLFRAHSQLQVPDPMLQVCRLYDVFTSLTGSDETLDHFYSWGQLLLSDFDDLDKNMADAGKLFINLEEWQKMRDFSFLSERQRQSLEAFFGKVMDDTALQQRFNDIWRYLGPMYQAYRDSLRHDGLAYEGMLYRDVVEQKDTDFHYKHYIFMGFNLLQKVEQRLFTILKDQGRAEFYWDYDVYYIKGEASRSHEAGRYIVQYLDRFPNELSQERISEGLAYDDIYDNLTRPKDVIFASAPTENIQTRAIADWLHQGDRLRDGVRTAIVLGDEHLLPTVIHSLPDEVRDVNITVGYPLQSTPVSALVSVLLDLQLRGRVAGMAKYRLRQLQAVCRHPYAKFLGDDPKVILEDLAQHKQYFPTRSYLTEGRGEAMAVLFSDLQPVDGRLDILPWLAQVLKLVGVGSREVKDPLMHEAIYRMYTLIQRLDDLMVVQAANGIPSPEVLASGKQPVTTAILRRLLTQVIQTTTIPFHGEPALGLQIMGVLETRNLDFDHVLLLSCNEGNLPKGVNDASFIPHSLRAGYELTTVENKVAIYAYYFYSLLQRAKDLTLTYNDSTEGGQTGEMSRFMLQYMVENALRQPIRRLALESNQEASPIRRQPIMKDATVMKRLMNTDYLSPSAINRYLRCQLQFYYSTLCGLRELQDDDDDDVTSADFGNIFHRAAQIIYTQLSDQGQHPVSQEMITALRKDRRQLETIVDAAFEAELFKESNPKSRPQYNGLQLLNRNVILLYLDRLLAYDQRHAPIDILALEKEYYSTITFRAGDTDITVRFGGFIDRLDSIMVDGRPTVRVVDYKTGRPLTTRPKDLDEVFNAEFVDSKHTSYYLQAFLYSAIIRHPETMVRRSASTQDKGFEAPQAFQRMAGQPVSPALHFIRQAASDNYDPTLAFNPARGQTDRVTDIEAIREPLLSSVGTLLSEVYNPALPFAPTSHHERCNTCPYNKICGL